MLALAQPGGMAGLVLFGVLSDRLLGGSRRLPLVLAGIGSTAFTLVIEWSGAGGSGCCSWWGNGGQPGHDPT